MKKKYIVLVVILVLIFSIFYYKKIFTGNNIIKQSKEKIVESILNDTVLNYKATIKTKIYSNKNDNEYEIKIEENEQHSYLEVMSKSDISGLIIEESKDKLIIRNTKLKLEKIYENYTPMINNCLFLNSFLEEYNESNIKKQYEEDGNIIIEIQLEKYTKYIKYKELYIDKKTGLPKKLIIKTSDKQPVVCIEYINIEIL
ncbi:MAG: hypothetical protein HFJ45_01775 [Clostridia bacterium]|nr:hypothetical protein [Clostridia bacterium]